MVPFFFFSPFFHIHYISSTGILLVPGIIFVCVHAFLCLKSSLILTFFSVSIKYWFSWEVFSNHSSLTYPIPLSYYVKSFFPCRIYTLGTFKPLQKNRFEYVDFFPPSLRLPGYSAGHPDQSPGCPLLLPAPACAQGAGCSLRPPLSPERDMAVL